MGATLRFAFGETARLGPSPWKSCGMDTSRRRRTVDSHGATPPLPLWDPFREDPPLIASSAAAGAVAIENAERARDERAPTGTSVLMLKRSCGLAEHP